MSSTPTPTPTHTDVDGTASHRNIGTAEQAAVTKDIRTAVREVFERNRGVMTPMLAQKLGIPEVEVIRNLPEDVTVELDVARWEEIIRDYEALGDVYVIASSEAVTLEAQGTFGKFSTTGPFFNVQNGSLDMHIRYQALASVFAVTKPGHMDGVETISFQWFAPSGRSAFKVFLTFGGKAPTPERYAQFHAIRDKYRKAN